MPLCRPCHLRYDRDARQNPASRARHAAAIRESWASLSPEARERRLAGIKKVAQKKEAIHEQR
jgi:hypothetical protein